MDESAGKRRGGVKITSLKEKTWPLEGVGQGADYIDSLTMNLTGAKDDEWWSMNTNRRPINAPQSTNRPTTILTPAFCGLGLCAFISIKMVIGGVGV